MKTCNRCGSELLNNRHYFELEITAKKMFRPMPFFFSYCSQNCIFDDMVIRIRVESKSNDADDSYNNYKWENPDD